MRGSSPINTQAALTSRQPASRTCAYASASSTSDETPRNRSSPDGKSDPMSPSPAAPSSASISACAMTSPSEWPASPRGWSNSTPPSTSGTPSSSACTSTPMPTRRSATLEHSGQLGQRADLNRPLRWVVQVAPGPAADVHGAQARCARGEHVVVDAVADVGDPPALAAAGVDHSLEELRRRLLDAPVGGRRDEVDVETDAVVRALRRVAGEAEPVAALPQLVEARPRVVVEVAALEAAPAARFDTEQLVDTPMSLATGREAADHSGKGEPRHAEVVGDLRPHARFVDEGLADVE